MNKQEEYWKGFGRRVFNLRKEKGYTAKNFAELVGLNPHYQRQLEIGARRPSIMTLLLFAKYLNVSVDELLDTYGSAKSLFED